MSYNEVVQAIADAQTDAQTLEDVINGAPDTQFKSRLGRMLWTLATINSRVDTVYIQANNAINSINKQKSSIDSAYNTAITSIDSAYPNMQASVNTKLSSLDAAIEQAAADALANKGWNDILVQTPNGETQRAKNQRNTSIYDFFTKDELTAYKAAPTTYDASKQVQAFFDYIVANNVGVANATGDFKTSKQINFIGASKTTQLVGHLKLLPLSNFVGDNVFFFAPLEVSWHGTLDLFTSDYVYANRKAEVGFHAGTAPNGAAAPRAYIREIITGGYRQIGANLSQASTGLTIGKLTAHANGSGLIGTPTYTTPDVTLSNRVDDDNSGTGQYTEFNVSALPPSNLKTGLHIRIPNSNSCEIYTVVNVDRTNNKIRVCPNVDYTLTSDVTANYVFGAGIYTAGGDASVLNINNIWVTANSYGIWQGALYPAHIGSVVSEMNFATLALGLQLDAATLGGTINYLYTESNQFDFVLVTRVTPSFRFLNDVTFNLDKVQLLGRLRSRKAQGNYYGSYNYLDGVKGTSNSTQFSFQKIVDADYAREIDLSSLDTSPRYQLWGDYSALSIPLKISSEDRITKLNYSKQQIYIGCPRRADMSCTNTLTFTTPSGYTFQDGSTSYVSNGLNGMTQFVFVADVGRKQVFFQKFEKYKPTAATVISGTAVYDPPSLATGAQVSTTVNTTGAWAGDILACSFSNPLQGVRMWAEMAQAQIATVYFRNDTGATVDLPSGTIKVKVV